MEFIAHPAVLVFLVSSLVAGVVWAVRLEGRINANETDKEKFKEQMIERVKDIEADVKDTRTRFFEHAANAAVHHNAEAYSEFKNALERRFLGVEGSLKDILREVRKA